MILTGNQIKMARENGWLDISDWDESRLNPNSYNLRLGDTLMVYTEPILTAEDGIPQDIIDRLMRNDSMPAIYGSNMVLDMKKKPLVKKFHIPALTGFVLQPGIIYLGQTIEHTKTSKFIPMLEGRSSIGRLGISIHSTAGFGDIGFEGYWTLEISCVQPVRIYPGVEICQIYYHTIAPDESIWIPNDDNPDIMKYDNGKYQKDNGVQASQLWKEFVE